MAFFLSEVTAFGAVGVAVFVDFDATGAGLTAGFATGAPVLAAGFGTFPLTEEGFGFSTAFVSGFNGADFAFATGLGSAFAGTVAGFAAGFAGTFAAATFGFSADLPGEAGCFAEAPFAGATDLGAGTIFLPAAGTGTMGFGLSFFLAIAMNHKYLIEYHQKSRTKNQFDGGLIAFSFSMWDQRSKFVQN